MLECARWSLPLESLNYGCVLQVSREEAAFARRVVAAFPTAIVVSESRAHTRARALEQNVLKSVCHKTVSKVRKVFA